MRKLAICGTTSDSEELKDPSGNRRFVTFTGSDIREGKVKQWADGKLELPTRNMEEIINQCSHEPKANT